ncbi:MAG: hypothetical protein PHG16_04830 [Lachnospiraceae bacterium]|nr:hypothetical protein [Lachnospiraceae bacterium]
MRIHLSKKKAGLAALALVLVAALSIGTALAYFTTYSSAEGTVTMDMGFTETVPHEKVDKDGKHVTIENVGDYDCYVRVKAFASIELKYQAPGNDWNEGEDGYWYYDKILPAKKTSSELTISYTYPVVSDEDKNQEFNIVVVQECAPVIYDGDNQPTADWTNPITTEPTE